MKKSEVLVGSPVGGFSQKSDALNQWIAEVDCHGAFPEKEVIVALLAKCPDPSCKEAVELEDLLIRSAR